MRILLPGKLSLIARQQNSNYKCQLYFDPKKKLECNSVRQFNEYVKSLWCRPTIAWSTITTESVGNETIEKHWCFSVS
jgi:hypothetical protein